MIGLVIPYTTVYNLSVLIMSTLNHLNSLPVSPRVCPRPHSLLIFINDICSVFNNHNVSVKLFAGDTKLNSSIDTKVGYMSLQNY